MGIDKFQLSEARVYAILFYESGKGRFEVTLGLPKVGVIINQY